MKKNIWIIIALVVVSSSIYYILQKRNVSNSNEIKIGAIIPLTGDAAEWGKQAKNSLEIAISVFNQKNQSQVRLFIQDSKSSPVDAVNACKFLIETEKVIAIIGDLTSANTLAIAPICENNKVLLISPVASSPNITNAGNYVYRIWPSDNYEANFVAKWFNENNFSKLGILYINDDYGISLKKAFDESFSKNGGKILVSEGYVPNNANFKTIISKFKNSNIDAVYIISFYADAAVFVKQAKELGLNVTIVGTSSLKNEAFIKLAGNSSAGVIFPDRMGIDIESKSEIIASFVNEYKAKYGILPGLVEAQTYDAVNLILNAISNGAKTGTEIKRNFDDYANNNFYEGVTGSIIFDKYGDIVPNNFRLMTIENGNFKLK